MRGCKSQIFVNGSIVINFTSINGKCKQAQTQINTINNPLQIIWIYANDYDDNAARATYDKNHDDDEGDAVMHNVTQCIKIQNRESLHNCMLRQQRLL